LSPTAALSSTAGIRVFRVVDGRKHQVTLRN
jgi:hypothetical protein